MDRRSRSNMRRSLGATDHQALPGISFVHARPHLVSAADVVFHVVPFIFLVGRREC
jgi:hypothetical protein